MTRTSTYSIIVEALIVVPAIENPELYDVEYKKFWSVKGPSSLTDEELKTHLIENCDFISSVLDEATASTKDWMELDLDADNLSISIVKEWAD